MRALAMLVMVVAVGCGPRSGDPCTAGQLVCDGKSSALICQNGAFESFPCPGPLGCGGVTESSTTQRCDVRDSLVGSACPANSGQLGYCFNATTAVYCLSEKWTPVTCSGGGDCTTNAGLEITCNH